MNFYTDVSTSKGLCVWRILTAWYIVKFVWIFGQRFVFFKSEVCFLIYYFLILFLTVIVKAYLSGIEVAMKNVQRRMIFSEDESEKDEIFVLDKYIVTVNLLKSIIMLCFGGFVFYNIGQVVSEIYSYETNPAVYYLIEVVILIITLYVLAIFGGFIPKKFALKAAKSVMNFGLFPVKFIYYLFSFFFVPFVKLSEALNRVIGIDKTVRDDDVTQEEIMMMIEAGGEKGTIDYDEREMIANVFEFDDKTAGDIVTHRKDIVAIPLDSGIDDIIKIILEEKYSRIPVYEESIDNIIGILHIKDVMKRFIVLGKDNFEIKELLMEPFFVPFTKKTDELFKEMQENKIHLCVVLDEYGGTLGIVSMEDLIEEVMGNILDEYDDEEKPEIVSNDGVNFYIDGKADYKETCEYLGIEKDEEEYDTMSGFFIGKMGHIPEINEEFSFQVEKFIFYTEKVEENRISLIKAVKMEESSEKETETIKQ